MGSVAHMLAVLLVGWLVLSGISVLALLFIGFEEGAISPSLDYADEPAETDAPLVSDPHSSLTV